MKYGVIVKCLTLCSILMYRMQKTPIKYFSNDVQPNEALQEVAKTRQDLLYEVAGVKIPKPKDPREGLYALVNVGVVFTPSLGSSSMLGIETGYDFIFGKHHSLRIFGFFDRTNYGAFGDFEFDANKPNKMQIYRGGFSAEYRIYATRYIGFRMRLGSFGAYSFSRTDSAALPTLSTKRTKWFYPTFAFGPIFIYGKHHELFVGYDLLDYEKERGMSVNYLKYSYKF